MSHAYQPVAPVQESNGLGLAGFILALLGLFTGGVLSIIGLILSLVALGRRPKGFAVAGVIVSLLGMCGWFVAIVALGLGAVVLAALGLSAIMLAEPQKAEISADMIKMAVAIKRHEDETRYLPAELGQLGLDPAVLVDPWGERYQYHFDEDLPSGFDIVSTGADRKLGTLDDLRLSTLGESWSAGGFGMDVKESDDGGRVTITLGGRTLTAEGSDAGGKVVIDFGDRKLEIVGDESGGRVNVKSDTKSDTKNDKTPPPAPVPDTTPDPDPDPPPAPDAGDDGTS